MTQTTPMKLDGMIENEVDAMLDFANLKLSADEVRRVRQACHIVTHRVVEALGGLNAAKVADAKRIENLANAASKKHAAWCRANAQPC